MKKWVEIVLGVLLGLLLLFRGAELWLGSKIRKAAATELFSASDGIYKLDIGRVSVGLFDRSVKIKNVTILTDSMRLDHLTIAADTIPQEERKYKPGLKVSIAELFVKGVWFKRHHENPPADTALVEGIQDNSLHRNLAKTFERLEISRIRMRGVDAEYSVRKDNDTVSYRIRRSTIEADDYDINSDPQQRPLHFGDIRLTVRKFEHTYQFGSMTMSADTLRASTATGTLSVNSLNIEPKYEKSEFAYMNPQHVDWTFYRLGRIDMWGIDVASLANRKHLSADSVLISRLEAGSYKDRNVVRVEWQKYMFYESLHRLPLTLDIRSVEIASGTAFYEELPKEENQSAIIRFSDIHAKVTNLSNMENPPAKNITVHAGGKVMGQGVLDIEFLAPASPSDSRFEVKGTMGPMDMKIMNPLVEPLAKARVDDGRINSINFHVTGNTHNSHVEMTLLYENLYVTIMKEEEDGQTHDRRFISALANNMVLRESNPDRYGKLHHGSGNNQRDMYRSQYNYMWKSLFPGIAESVGIPKALINSASKQPSQSSSKENRHATPKGIIPTIFKSKDHE